MQITNNYMTGIQNNRPLTESFNTESEAAIETEDTRDFWTDKEMPFAPVVSDTEPAVRKLFTMATYRSLEQMEAIGKVKEAIKSNTPALFIGNVISDTVSGPVGTELVHQMTAFTLNYLVDIDLSRVKDPQLVEEYMRFGNKEGDYILLENPDKASPEMLQRIADVTMKLPKSKFSRIFAAATGEQHIDIDGFKIVDVSRKTINHDLKART